jgi:hypothetical protein
MRISTAIASTWLAGRESMLQGRRGSRQGTNSTEISKDYYEEKGKLLKEFPSFLVRKMTSCGNFSTILLTPSLILVNLSC